MIIGFWVGLFIVFGVGIADVHPFGIAPAVCDEHGGIVEGFPVVLRPVVEHPFLPAPGTHSDGHHPAAVSASPSMCGTTL